MESFDQDEDLAAVIGQGFKNYNPPQYCYSSLSSPNMINILSSNSITSLYNFPTITPLIKQNYKPIINNHSKLRRIDHDVINHSDQPSSNSALKFGNINPSENLQQVNNPLPLYHEDNSVVSDIFRSQGLNHINSENTKQTSRPTKKKTRTRPPAQVYEHIIAERKRRKQLSQLFIALSAIVPGLKKTDKTSILGGAIEYLKHLKQREQNWEQKSATKKAMDSGVSVKKSQFFVEDEGSSDEKSGGADEPEIEARVVDNNILIRIHCGKQKGILANLLSKVESLNMVVVNTNVTPFGNSALDITIIAETEKGFSSTVKEVATALRAAFRPAAA